MIPESGHADVLRRLLLSVVATCCLLFGCSAGSPVPITNVILISIDTLRADHLSSYGHPLELTPHIDRVAREGALFEQVISPVPITLPSHSSLMTGTIPPVHGVRDNTDYRLDDSMTTLAEILKEKGFRTGAVVGAFVLDSGFGLSQGFDSYDDRIAGTEGELYIERRGEEVSRLAGEWLTRNRESKNFLFLHYFDPHADYRSPEPFAGRFADNPYAGEVAYTDWCIGKVLETLENLDLYDSSLIVVTSDHGEALGEHKELTHAYYVYQSTLRVPWVIKWPGADGLKRVVEPVSLVDVMPTILGLLQIPPPPQIQGESLVPAMLANGAAARTRRQYCESLLPTKYGCSPLRGIVENRWKYIQTVEPELYDLREDPDETLNLAKQEPDRVERMDALLSSMLVGQNVGSQASIDDVTRQRLEALGYLRGPAVDESVWENPREDAKDFIDLYLKIKRANTFYESGDSAEAKRLCMEVLSERPGQIHALRMMGDIHHDEGDLAQATIFYSRAVRALPENVEGQVDLGVVLAQQGRWAESLEHFSKALSLDPHSDATHNNLGNVYASSGRIDKALHHFREALNSNPLNAEAHLNLCMVLGRQRKIDEALRHCREALRLKPGWAEAEKVQTVLSDARVSNPE